MRARRLGKSPLIISEIGLGCMGMSEFYGAADEAESLATIHAAVDHGVTLLDTADVYGLGRNEELVGRAIAGHHSGIILATKFGIVRDAEGRSVGVNGRPEYVQQCCDASLRRLRIPAIDLYYLHRVDPSVPIEETVGAMARLVEQGKVCYLGLSEAGLKTIRRAHATHPIAAVQNEYSLWTRDPEDEVLGVCRELGIGLVAYSPLGRGFLTGQIQRFEDFAPDDYRRKSPRFQGENFQKNLELVQRIKEIASENRCTPGQLALAWVLSRGEDIVPIPGTKRRKYLEENLGAADVTLNPEDLGRIEEMMPRGAAAGARYPEALMKRIGL
jgi:aryl-alcohol dehydrogenase-like predicted oxidoreductase